MNTLNKLPVVFKDAEIARAQVAERGKAASFFIDDVIWIFRDLARNRPASIFDHPFLGGLKECHDRYGLKLQLNCFYRTDFFYAEPEFTLAQMPDVWKAEWQANRDWLKLGYHTLQEFPDYPAVNMSYDAAARIFDVIVGEFNRFAGEGVFTRAMVHHWGPVSQAACRAFYDRGVKMLEASFGDRYEYVPERDRTLLPYGHGARLEQNRMPEAAFYRRDSRDEAIAWSVCSYNHLSPEQFAATTHSFNYLKDKVTGMRFKNMFNDAPCLNLFTPELLRETLPGLAECEYLIFSDHEQYFYKDYLAYQPDYMDKIRLMCEQILAQGRRFIHIEELIDD